MYHVCLMLTAAAHLDAVSKLVSLVVNPAVPPQQQLSVGLMPAGTSWNPETDDPYELITHWFGCYSGIPETLLSALQALPTTLPTPPGGWPWVVGGITRMTEAQALAAVPHLQLYVGSSAAPDTSIGQTLLAQALAEHNLMTLDV